MNLYTLCCKQLFITKVKWKKVIDPPSMNNLITIYLSLKHFSMCIKLYITYGIQALNIKTVIFKTHADTSLQFLTNHSTYTAFSYENLYYTQKKNKTKEIIFHIYVLYNTLTHGHFCIVNIKMHMNLTARAPLFTVWLVEYNVITISIQEFFFGKWNIFTTLKHGVKFQYQWYENACIPLWTVCVFCLI